MNELQLTRIDYPDATTIGLFVVNGIWWGYSLEDQKRAAGVKVKGATCIPAGRYRVVVSLSTRFKRWMPELHSVPGFLGIRLHGGNTHLDTEGCPVIAANRIGRASVQGSLESRLMAFFRSQIPARSGESEADFWARLPETWITVQDGPLSPVPA